VCEEVPGGHSIENVTLFRIAAALIMEQFANPSLAFTNGLQVIAMLTSNNIKT
jgi:hypothetical protein